MKLEVSQVNVWAASLEDRPGNLAAKLKVSASRSLTQHPSAGGTRPGPDRLPIELEGDETQTARYVSLHRARR